MIGDGKALGVRHVVLKLLDLGIKKLFNPATIKTDQVVVVVALVEFIDRFVALEMAAGQYGSLLKLG
ncbi:hypothetical protein GALL_521920 [mine drainage metagenome]|uniref:Uncharacterized protein n=1 Tax=mine drainage metagenome TaxID=410659 RepID=A0A1J5P674_9ZZZZ